MQLEQFMEQLEGTEQVEYQALVEENQNGGDDKAIRGHLVCSAMEVLKRIIATLVCSALVLYKPLLNQLTHYGYIQKTRVILSDNSGCTTC